MGAIQGQAEAEKRPDSAKHRKLSLSKRRSTTFLVSGMSCSWEGSLAPLWSPYHQHSRYSSVFYHYISDLAMSSQTDVSSKFQLSNSQSRVNKILLAAFLHPGSVHEISWLDHFTAALEVLQLITQIFTSSEGETKCIRPKSVPVGVWQAETNECEDSTVYSTGSH